jgi:hypothetical protein
VNVNSPLFSKSAVVLLSAAVLASGLLTFSCSGKAVRKPAHSGREGSPNAERILGTWVDGETDAAAPSLFENPMKRACGGTVSKRWQDKDSNANPSNANPGDTESPISALFKAGQISGIKIVDEIDGVKGLAPGKNYQVIAGKVSELGNSEELEEIEEPYCVIQTRAIDKRDKTLTRKIAQTLEEGQYPLPKGREIRIDGVVAEQEWAGAKLGNRDDWVNFCLEGDYAIDLIVCHPGKNDETVTLGGLKKTLGPSFKLF